MKNRLPLILAATALAVALFGTVPLALSGTKTTAATTAGALNKAFSVSRDGPVEVGTAVQSLARLNVPAGKYVIFAKASLENPTPQGARLECGLSAGRGSDKSVVTLHHRFTNLVESRGQNTALPFTVLQSFGAPGVVELSCQQGAPASSGVVTVSFIKITAVSVDRLSSKVLS